MFGGAHAKSQQKGHLSFGLVAERARFERVDKLRRLKQGAERAVRGCSSQALNKMGCAAVFAGDEIQLRLRHTPKALKTADDLEGTIKAHVALSSQGADVAKGGNERAFCGKTAKNEAGEMNCDKGVEGQRSSAEGFDPSVKGRRGSSG
jgi:hypothetical protein